MSDVHGSSWCIVTGPAYKLYTTWGQATPYGNTILDQLMEWR